MKKDILKGAVDGVIDGDNMWIITDTSNCLFRYRFSRDELELEAVFPETMRSDFEPFSQIVKLKDEIYLIPRLAKGIYCYHLTKKTFQKINLSFDMFRDDKNMKAMAQGKYIYCINRFPDIVIKIDSVTKEVNLFYADTNQYIKKGIESIVYDIYKEPCIYQEEIIWTNYNNTLTVFNIEKGNFHTIALGIGAGERIERMKNLHEEVLEDWIIGVRVFGDEFWLFSFEGKIFQYHNGIKKIENRLLDGYVQYIDDDKIRVSIIYDMIPFNKELWIIPSYKNRCIKYKDLEQYEEAFKDYVVNWGGNRRSYTFAGIINETGILLYSYYESCFYVLDTKNDSVNKMVVHVPYAKLAKENPEFERMLVQDGFCGFDNLEYLYEKLSVGDKGVEEQEKLLFDTVGKQIYQTAITSL